MHHSRELFSQASNEVSDGRFTASIPFRVQFLEQSASIRLSLLPSGIQVLVVRIKYTLASWAWRDLDDSIHAKIPTDGIACKTNLSSNGMNADASLVQCLYAICHFLFALSRRS